MDLFAEFDVDLDQALIWSAFRCADLVREAKFVRRGDHRLTWMLALLTVRERGISFVLSYQAAAEELLGALRRGEIRAYADEQTFEKRWFNRASIINAAIKPGSPDLGERMVLVRQRDADVVLHEFDDETQILRTKDRAEYLRFDAADLVRAFPALKADAPNEVEEAAEPHPSPPAEAPSLNCGTQRPPRRPDLEASDPAFVAGLKRLDSEIRKIRQEGKLPVKSGRIPPYGLARLVCDRLGEAAPFKVRVTRQILEGKNKRANTFTQADADGNVPPARQFWPVKPHA